MGATPYAPNLIPPIAYPWWKYGLQVWPPRPLTRRQKAYLVLYYFLLMGGSASLVVFLLSLFGFL
jgi:hypothetical protein